MNFRFSNGPDPWGKLQASHRNRSKSRKLSRPCGNHLHGLVCPFPAGRSTTSYGSSLQRAPARKNNFTGRIRTAATTPVQLQGLLVRNFEEMAGEGGHISNFCFCTVSWHGEHAAPPAGRTASRCGARALPVPPPRRACTSPAQPEAVGSSYPRPPVCLARSIANQRDGIAYC